LDLVVKCTPVVTASSMSTAPPADLEIVRSLSIPLSLPIQCSFVPRHRPRPVVETQQSALSLEPPSRWEEAEELELSTVFTSESPDELFISDISLRIEVGRPLQPPSLFKVSAG
jgi:hypothetical protein